MLEAFQCLCCGLKRCIHSLICYWKVGTIQEEKLYWACTDFVENLTIASEDKLVWAAFHALQQSATKSPLCVLQPLTFTKSLLLLQWLSMVWVHRGKQMNGSIQGKVCIVKMGQMCTVSQCRLLFTFKDSPLENILVGLYSVS